MKGRGGAVSIPPPVSGTDDSRCRLNNRNVPPVTSPHYLYIDQNPFLAQARGDRLPAMERGTPYGSRRSSREQVTGGGGHTPGSASLPTGLDLGLSPIGPSPSGGTLHGDDGNLLEGWLKKRGTRIQAMWSERYFILRGDHLLYYLKQGDQVGTNSGQPIGLFVPRDDDVAFSLCVVVQWQDARGAYILDRSCVVSEVKQHTSSYEKKKLYVFRILWPEAIEYTETVPSQANIESGDSLGSTDRGGTSRQSSHK